MEALVFYDIPGNAAKDKAWSPNTWKTRYSLNYKGLPYTTVWVEYPDIAGVCAKIGAPPTETAPDGSPHYTLPAIFDPNTQRAVSESAAIARYLDATYPATRTLIPAGTDALHAAFTCAFEGALMPDVLALGAPAAHAQLHARSAAYFRATREALLHARLEELAPAGSEKRARHWEGVRGTLRMVAGWVGADGKEQEFVMGERVGFADFTVAGFLMVMRRTLGEESGEWREVSGWDGGRWGRLMDALKEYEGVDVGTDAVVDVGA